MSTLISSWSHTGDLGDFDECTDRLASGIQECSQELDATGLESRIAPVGEAYRWLYHYNTALWKKLYSWDHFHPSLYGTWLQACVIYICCYSLIPFAYNPQWWEASRYMQTPTEKPLSLPTEQEAAESHGTACLVVDCFKNDKI
jgi:hypothetical protein